MSDEWIRSKLDKLDDKVDQIGVRLDKSDKDHGEMAVDLRYHIQRTNLLEEELKPIKNKYQQMMGIIKFILAAAGMTGVVELILRIRSGL